MNQTVKLTRTTEVIEIPSGRVSTLPENMSVRIMQSRGDSYTVWTDYGQMYRIEGKDADSLGMQPSDSGGSAPELVEFNERDGLGHSEVCLRSRNPRQYCGPWVDLLLQDRTRSFNCRCGARIAQGTCAGCGCRWKADRHSNVDDCLRDAVWGMF